jgi:hypothetical protein
VKTLGFGFCVLEGITEAKLPTPSATLHGKSKILESDDGNESTSFPPRASTLEVCIATRGQWIVSWRSGVVSCSSTTTSLDGVAQRGLDAGHVMFNMCRAGVLSDVDERMTKITWIFIPKIARRFDGSDGFVACA